MKCKYLTAFGIAGLGLLLGAGCGQSTSNSPSETNKVTSAAEGTEAPAPSLKDTVNEVGDTTKKAVSDASQKADELISKAQSLVNEKNYSGAMDIVNQLSNFKLTAEQQKLVDDLKTTIQKALQSDAGKKATEAIGNLMGGEKN